MRKFTLFVLLSFILSLAAMGDVVFSFNTADHGPEIGKNHYGIFLEEINHAGDGGLYAELISNRSFEDNDEVAENWSAVGSAQLELLSEDLMNNVQRHALRLTANKGGDGVENAGFWGMRFVKDETYKVSLWMRSQGGYTGKVTFSLMGNEGTCCGTQETKVELSAEWTKVSCEVIASESYGKGTFSITLDAAAEVDMDMVSLFPPTYKDRPNGCRRDLAEMLAAMKPSFMRFPGGCYIEGEWRNDKPHFNGEYWEMGSPNRFEWKQTIGALEKRPGHWNVNWNYRVSDGLGFHEMLQLCEDLGAEPLFVVNMGMGHGWYENYWNIDEYIQEALDALEYCNGDASTTYGAMRIANGHPAPFNLRLIEIGNENYNYSSYNNSDQSDHYAERYIQFYEAIKERYPDCFCIGNVQAWSTDNPTWRNEHPVDAVDEHYYRNPDWFVSQYDKYNTYDRNTSPKVYAGEYAVTSNCGAFGDLKSALGEAVYMLGMENNSDICVMNSYAPIFVNENDQKWLPDMIRFDSDIAYGTPSYYVQQLMPNYVGKQNIHWNESGNNNSSGGTIGLSTWKTSAVFGNVKVNGNPVSFSQDWTEPSDGAWSIEDEDLVQSSTSMEGALYVNDAIWLSDNFTFEVDATKTGGAEGFLIAFNYKDPENYVWLNLGGWNNTKHAVEICTNGTKSQPQSVYGYLETGVQYHIKIEVTSGSHAKCYMDDELLFDFDLPVKRNLYISSTIDDENNMLYVKVVNPAGTPQKAQLKFADKGITSGTLIQMKGESGDDANNRTNPYNVVPEEYSVNVFGNNLDTEIPAYSFNIFSLNLSDNPAAEAKVEEGTYYYLYNEETGMFLSRGADWGTRAAMDNFGIPMTFTAAGNGTYTITYADETGNKFFGKDGQPYTDVNWYRTHNWKIEHAGQGLFRMACGTEADSWLVAEDDACTFGSEGSALRFITVEEYNALMKNRKKEISVENLHSMDMTSWLVNPLMDESTEGWETEGWSPVTSYGVTEAYESYGKISQKIENLPAGIYEFSLQGFFRGSSNANCVNLESQGIELGTAYIFAGTEQQRVAPWASERTSDGNPNSMAEASALFSEGKYTNTVRCRVEEGGSLTVGLAMAQKVGYQWLIWNNARLVRYEEAEDCTSLIVNPSFETSINNGWTNNGMQRQNNNEPKAYKVGNYYCEAYVGNGSLGNVSVSQTITDLRKGEYLLKAHAHAELDGAKSTQAYIFAGDDKTEVSFADEYQVRTTVYDGTLTLGFKTENTPSHWVSVDDFHLYYLGELGGEEKLALQKAIDILRKLVENKFILPATMVNDATSLIEEAEQLLANEEAKVDDLTRQEEALRSHYELCKAYRIPVERDDPYVKYLFAYFPSNDNENLYYAVSDDGYDYTPLNEGERVMWSDSVAIKKGIRDPHVLRGVDGKTFYMVATDMRCAEGWASNRGIVMYRSTDLIHWQHSTVHFPDRFPEWAGVTRVWAPATIWDPNYDNGDGTKGRYMVYFSLLTNDGKCKYDKVYYCYANDDFTDLLTDPVYFYDRGSATIDADIVFDETDMLYHMIYKNEGSGGICSVTARTLTAQDGEELGSQWRNPTGRLEQTNVAVEGGGLFRLINSNTWVMMYDCYGNGYYQFCSTDDWEKFTLQAQTTMRGAFTPRHGSVLPLTAEEYNAVLKAFPTAGLEEVETSVDAIEHSTPLPDGKYLDGQQLIIRHDGRSYHLDGTRK